MNFFKGLYLNRKRKKKYLNYVHKPVSNHFYSEYFVMIEELEKQVTKTNPKMKLKTVVKICLDFVEEHPELINKIGIAWYNETCFIINTKIFGIFIKRKPNSINKNLKKNGFKCIKTKYSMREKKYLSFTFNDLPDSKSWVLQYSDKLQKKSKKNISNIFFDFPNLNDYLYDTGNEKYFEENEEEVEDEFLNESLYFLQ